MSPSTAWRSQCPDTDVPESGLDDPGRTCTQHRLDVGFREPPRTVVDRKMAQKVRVRIPSGALTASMDA